MRISGPFRRLTGELASAHGSPRWMAHLVRPLLEEVLADRRWLQEHCARFDKRADGRYPIWRHPAGLAVMFAQRFAPGRDSLVHDHKTWGLVGVWKGCEHERRFARTDRRRGFAELTPTWESNNRPGAVTVIVPGADEIHQVVNRTRRAAYSLHIYGLPTRAPDYFV